MSLRSFTVFQDASPSDTSRPRAASVPLSTPPLSLKPLNSNQATTITTTEKENLNPLTGERAGPNNNTKKRKTSVLATKAHVPLTSKKQKESKESAPDAKKRKPSTSIVKAKTGAKKDGKTLNSSRKGVKKLLRKVSSLPKVEEEEDKDSQEKISQAEIDSRCYDLTVQPLADLSQAYEQDSAALRAEEEKDKFRPVKVSFIDLRCRTGPYGIFPIGLVCRT